MNLLIEISATSKGGKACFDLETFGRDLTG